MGNSPSTTSKLPASTSANFHPEVEVLQAKSFDAHYGEVKIVKDKRTSQQYIVKDVVSNTKQAFETDLRFYGERVNVKHPNVVSVLGYTSEDKHNFCSTYYKISIFIEPLDHHLQTDFESRKAGKVYYTESELLAIADNLVGGLSYFESQGHSHGDIRPFNIFYKDRTYKLSDPSLTPQKGYNALNLAVIQGAKTLLAPEWLQQVPHSNLEIKGNKSRADVYSLGQTLLALATLLNSEDAYDYKHGTISQNLVKERLQLVANRYSDFTYHLIKDMLIVDPANRPDFVTLSNRLLPYQHDIRAGSHLAFFEQHHQHHDHHGYHHDHHDHHHHDHDHHHHHEVEQIPAPVVQHHGEVAKRSALPVDVHTTTVHHTPVVESHHDDLDARIRAALDRSAATFKTIETKDTHTYTPAPAYTTTHHTSTYTTPQVDYSATRHTGETVKSHAAPVSHHVDVAPTTSYHHTSTYVPTSTYTYTPSHHVDYTYTAPTSYTHHTAAPVVDVHHSVTPVTDVHHVDRSAEVERIVKSSQHFGDVKKSYVAPAVDVHHSTYTAPVDVHHTSTYTAPVDVHHSSTYTAPAYTHHTYTTPVVDVHHSVTPVTDVHHVDRSAEVEKIVRSSQHFAAEPAHHATTNYSYSTYTAPVDVHHSSTYTAPVADVHHSNTYTTPASYTTYTAPVTDVHHSTYTAPVSYTHTTTPVVDVHHSTPVVEHRTEEHVVRSTPKHAEYNLSSSQHGAPASYTTTTYTNGHHFTPTDIHYSTTSHTVDPHYSTSVHGGNYGGDVHEVRTVEYHH